MDRVFNKDKNKNEYFFSDEEVEEFMQFLINSKFLLWVRGLDTFYLRDKYKSTQIEIHIKSRTVLISNEKEISKMILNEEQFAFLILSINHRMINTFSYDPTID